MVHRAQKDLFLFVLSVLLILALTGSAWAATISGPATLYEGDTGSYTAGNYGSNTSCKWSWKIAVSPYTTLDSITKTASSTYYSNSYRDPGSYSLQISCTGGTTSAGSKAITIIAMPAPTINGPTTSMTGTTNQYTAVQKTVSTNYVEWSVDGTVISAGPSAPLNHTFSTLGDHTVTAKVYNVNHSVANATTNITVTVAPPAPTITMSGPTTSYAGETKQYSITHDATDPVTIAWSVDGTVIDGAVGTSVDIPFTTAGTQNVAVTVYPTGYPSAVATSTIPVMVSGYPAPTITMDGSTTSYVGETKQYTMTSTSTDPLTIAWSLNGTVIEGATGASVDIPFSATGSYDVSVTVYPSAYPNSKATSTISVMVSQHSAPTLTMAGPTTSIEGETKQYTVTHDSSLPVTIEWTLNGVVIDGAVGESVDIPFTTVGTQTVAVSVYPTAYPNAVATKSTSVVVSEYPAPTLTMGGPTTSIVGETKQYSVTHDSSLPVTIKWSVDGVVIDGAVGASVEIPFTTTGIYDVTVTVCPTAYPNSYKTGSIPVVVSEPFAPTLTMSGSTTSIVGETKQYTVSHDSSLPVTIEWSINGVTIDGAVGTSVDVPFTTAGRYDVAAIVYPTDYPNSYKTGTVSVVVSEYPAPTITLDGSTTSYEGETKQYTVTHDSSSPVAISWTLNGTVIDGATGTSVDIPFTTVGTQNVAVTVNLTAYPNSKRTGTISVVVSEYPAPTITMGGSTTSIVGETKQYSVTSTSTDPLTIAWSIDGTVIEGATGTSVDIPFSATGNYDVSVSVYPTAYPNSKRTGTVSVVVSEYPAPIITIAGSTTSIVGETKQYTVTSPSTDPLTISWSLNGTVIDGAVGVSVDIPFATAGTQNAAVIVYPTAYPNSKATSAISVVVSEYPAPTITLDGPMTSNVGETKRYTATSTSTDPLTISWTLNGAVIDGDTGTSIDIPFTMAGPQNVGVTVFSTAYPDSKKTSSILVMVSQYPAPSITMDGPTTAIAGGTGQYTVTHDSSLPVTIAWTLNGIVIEGAIGASVDVSFATTGNSTVAVTVYPTAHPDSKRTGSIPVVVSEYKAPSITMAGPRTSAVGGTGQYTVTHNSSLPVSIAWTLNGNVIEGATGASVGIPFTAAGSYDVGVTVYPTAYPDSKRTGSLAVAVSEVKAPLVGLSTIKSGIVGNTITLKATAVGQIAGIPLVVKWKLPDGTSVDALTTTYTPRLEDVGTATFKFTAYPEGYPDSTKESELQVPITNYALPTFTLRNYTKNTGIAPWIVVYGANANLTGITSGTLTYTWDMGDGSAAKPNKNKATHTYTQPGNYTVTLTVTDAKGNSTVVTDTVSVTPVSPISVDAITVTGTNKYMRAPVVGIFKSTISGGNPKADRFVNFAWTVNGQPVGRNSSQATYEFKEPGTYEIGLTVTSMSGLTGSGTTTVAVKENIPPECTIEATDYPDRKYTKLLSKCTDEDGRIRSWSWDLGNGQTKNTGTVYATYAESGTYTVSLTATDDSGSSVTVSQDVSAQR